MEETQKIEDKFWQEIPPEKMTKGFAIICYPSFSTDCEDVFYELFFGDEALCNIEIEKHQAKALIHKFTLSLAVNNRTEKVWE